MRWLTRVRKGQRPVCLTEYQRLSLSRWKLHVTSKHSWILHISLFHLSPSEGRLHISLHRVCTAQFIFLGFVLFLPCLYLSKTIWQVFKWLTVELHTCFVLQSAFVCGQSLNLDYWRDLRTYTDPLGVCGHCQRLDIYYRRDLRMYTDPQGVW